LSKDRVKLLHVGVREFFSQALVVGALLWTWDVFFSGRAARTLCGSHRDTLALPRSQG